MSLTATIRELIIKWTKCDLTNEEISIQIELEYDSINLRTEQILNSAFASSRVDEDNLDLILNELSNWVADRYSYNTEDDGASLSVPSEIQSIKLTAIGFNLLVSATCGKKENMKD